MIASLRCSISVSIILSVLFILTGSNFAYASDGSKTVQIQATVIPNSLTYSIGSSEKTIGKENQIDIPIIVSDLRGSGAGWKLSLLGDVSVQKVTLGCVACSSTEGSVVSVTDHGFDVSMGKGLGMGVFAITVTVVNSPTLVDFFLVGGL